MSALSNAFSKLNIIFLALLLVLIMAGELILEPMHYAAWPAFMIMIFFFMSHMNIKEAPSILIGSAFGLLNIILIVYWFDIAVPLFGGDMAKYPAPATLEAMFISKLIYIAVFVALIVFFKDIIPWIFNNYAFMCFTVAGAVSGGYTSAKWLVGNGNAMFAKVGNEALTKAWNGALANASMQPGLMDPYYWIGIQVVVGAIFIAGIYGITKILGKLAGAPAAHNDIKG